MTTTQSKTWSKEDEEQLIQMYTVAKADIEDIAEHLNKNNRSVISKLVKLKLYNKPEEVKQDKRTVKRMLQELEDLLDIEIDGLTLTKKENVEILVDAIKNKLEQSNK